MSLLSLHKANHIMPHHLYLFTLYIPQPQQSLIPVAAAALMHERRQTLRMRGQAARGSEVGRTAAGERRTDERRPNVRMVHASW